MAVFLGLFKEKVLAQQLGELALKQLCLAFIAWSS